MFFQLPSASLVINPSGMFARLGQSSRVTVSAQPSRTIDKNTGLQLSTRSYGGFGHAALIFGRIEAAPPECSVQLISAFPQASPVFFAWSIQGGPQSTTDRASAACAELMNGNDDVAATVPPAAAVLSRSRRVNFIDMIYLLSIA